ncbi:MAG TPA: hypothetical protein VEI97_04850, partial [bacterium]|nr:hypothetical protein [bacterium]
MSMDPRQRQKEILRMRREIELIEGSIEKNSQAAGQKETENKQLADAIREQEAENDRLLQRVEELEGQVVELDDEFKENQVTATRIRKEIKREEEIYNILLYRATSKKEGNVPALDEDGKPLSDWPKGEAYEAKLARLRTQLADLQNHLKDLRKNREGTEYKLRKTVAKIEEIQKHPLSKPVTQKIEKQKRQEREERAARGIAERTMEERLHEVEQMKILSSREFLQQILEERGATDLLD